MAEILTTPIDLTLDTGINLIRTEVSRGGLHPGVYARHLDRHYRRSGRLYSYCIEFERVCGFGLSLEEQGELSRYMSCGRALAHRIVRYILPGVVNLELPKSELVPLNRKLEPEDVVRIVGQFISESLEEYELHENSHELIDSWFSKDASTHFYTTLGFGQMMLAARQVWDSSPTVSEAVLFAELGSRTAWDKAFQEELN
jgi:hypothetical protein